MPLRPTRRSPSSPLRRPFWRNSAPRQLEQGSRRLEQGSRARALQRRVGAHAVGGLRPRRRRVPARHGLRTEICHGLVRSRAGAHGVAQSTSRRCSTWKNPDALFTAEVSQRFNNRMDADRARRDRVLELQHIRGQYLKGPQNDQSRDMVRLIDNRIRVTSQDIEREFNADFETASAGVRVVVARQRLLPQGALRRGRARVPGGARGPTTQQGSRTTTWPRSTKRRAATRRRRHTSGPRRRQGFS